MNQWFRRESVGNYRAAVGLLLLLSALSGVRGQGTAADYKRSDSLRTRLRESLYNVPAVINWIPKTHRFWYLTRSRQGSEFIMVDAARKIRKPAFDARRWRRS